MGVDFALLFRSSVRTDAAQLMPEAHLAEHVIRFPGDVNSHEVLRFTSSNSSLAGAAPLVDHLLTTDRHELRCRPD